jgi:hypothetical protein
MRRKIHGGKASPENPCLQSFIVFDGIVPPAEGSEPIIYFAQCPAVADPHFAVNLAGVLITFRKFCTHFTAASACDYVATDTHEFAILELAQDIWMAVQRKLSSSPNRDLLRSMLHSCKSLYNLFWPTPRRIPGTNDLTHQSRRLLAETFTMIVNSITWNDLAFIQLFDSYLQLDPGPLEQQLVQAVSAIQANTTVPIAHIAVLHSRYFVHSTFPRDVSRTIGLAMSLKFRYLFPNSLVKQEERLYWIIGLSRAASGAMTLYAPHVNVGGQLFPIVALRRLKWRIVIALRPECEIAPDVLSQIPKVLTQLQRLIKDVRVETCKGRKTGPYIVVRNESAERRLMLSHDNVSYPLIPVAENTIFLAQWFAASTARVATVAFPMSGDFVVYFKEDGTKEVVVLYKVVVGGVSAAVRECRMLAEEPQNIMALKVQKARP